MFEAGRRRAARAQPVAERDDHERPGGHRLDAVVVARGHRLAGERPGRPRGPRRVHRRPALGAAGHAHAGRDHLGGESRGARHRALPRLEPRVARARWHRLGVPRVRDPRRGRPRRRLAAGRTGVLRTHRGARRADHAAAALGVPRERHRRSRSRPLERARPGRGRRPPAGRLPVPDAPVGSGHAVPGRRSRFVAPAGTRGRLGGLATRARGQRVAPGRAGGLPGQWGPVVRRRRGGCGRRPHALPAPGPELHPTARAGRCDQRATHPDLRPLLRLHL